MPLQIVRNDITKMKVDAIVNAANEPLMGGGGVDGCIHRAAGPKLLAECATLHGCKTGSAKITKAYQLPCKYVIHAVGPRWSGGQQGEADLLTSCYHTSLMLANEYGCESIAFPLISAGIFAYPKDQALRIAIDTIRAFLLDHDMMVYLVIFDKKSYQISNKLFADLAAYIDDRYTDSQGTDRYTHAHGPYHLGLKQRDYRLPNEQGPYSEEGADGSLPFEDEDGSAPYEEEDLNTLYEGNDGIAFYQDKHDKLSYNNEFSSYELSVREEPVEIQIDRIPNEFSLKSLPSLNEALKEIDESFSEMLLRKIDESGMTDAECYKKANVDRRLFSKIRSNTAYRPSKSTAIAFAIALELPLEEMKDMLMKAGFALSHSHKFDIIVEYFVEHGNYNVFEINEALFAFDQSLIGG